MDKTNKVVKILLGDESFHRLVNGTASEIEKNRWRVWADESSENREAYEQAFQLLKEVRFVKAYKPSAEESWKDFYSKFILPKKKTGVFKIVDFKENRLFLTLRYAAVFLMASLLVIGYLFISNREKVQSHNDLASNVVISTGYKEQRILKLSDGSEIILAPHSRLTFKSDWLKERIKKVKLAGQAYFKIADPHPNAGHAKFEITTSYGVIRDFGTVFNVSTYGNRTNVVLVSGIVSVMPTTKASDKIFPVKLKPGQMAILGSSKQSIDIRKVNPRVYTSWTTKTLYFENTPLREFINDIKDFYGAPVVVTDSTLLNKKISGGVDRGSLPDMIKVVSSVLDIPLQVKNDTVYVGHILHK